MANKHHDRCPCCNGENKRVENITLPDGRQAERHIFNDENGNEVVEVFAEERRPRKLEERILRERKQIVAKETRETIQDGEVTQVEVRSLEPEVPLQIREKIGVADHAKVVDGDYVRKEEIAQLISDGVVAGVEAMMESMGPPEYDYEEPELETEPKLVPVAQEPYFNAQGAVAKNVADKKQKDTLINVVLGVVLVAQVLFFGYMAFVM